MKTGLDDNEDCLDAVVVVPEDLIIRSNIGKNINLDLSNKTEI